MTIPRGYTANHKVWDYIASITPNTSYSESHKPHGEWTPAAWLPVQRAVNDRGFEWWTVVSNGKVVALDRSGELVPAGLKKAWNIATSSDALVYTANDVSALSIDLTTGVAVTAAVTYTETELTAALRERGLIRHTERATDFISKPVGVADYDYYASAGTDPSDPKTWKFHNFKPQGFVAINCDYAMTYPVLPALATTEAVGDRTSGADGLLEDLFDGTTARTTAATGFFNSTQIAEVTRFASLVSAGDDIVCFLTANYPLAHITASSPITTSTESCLVKQVNSISAISAAGDYYMDYDAGAIFLYEAGGNAIPSPWVAGTTTITYYHYALEGTATNTVSTLACATGNLEYGDFLTYDSNSNFVKATLDISAAEGYSASDGTLYSADPEYDTETDNSVISLQLENAIDNHLFGIVGQVIGTTIFGTGDDSRGYLDRVATAFEGQTAANMQTPGSATGGRTDQLTYANAAEKMIVVNLIMR